MTKSLTGQDLYNYARRKAKTAFQVERTFEALESGPKTAEELWGHLNGDYPLKAAVQNAVLKTGKTTYNRYTGKWSRIEKP